MKVETRNYLLCQVSLVLDECHKLVSHLSSVSVLEETEVCQEVPEEVEVCQVVPEAEVCQSTQLPTSEMNNNDYWWDDYVSKLSQFSAEFYSLLSLVYADPLPTQISESDQSESIMSSVAENQSTSQIQMIDDN